MTHASLFSGIGGFDLAAQWMGWENKFHCEINDFCKQVLKYYWPDAQQYTDIKQSDFSVWRHRIDVLTGGFPCQPYSQAGKRKGKEDDRHLWPEMLKAIRTIQPRWVVGENVYGLVNWSGGLVFDEVQSDLEAAGYEVWPYVLPACAVNAPHRRDRIWFVAYASSNGHKSGRLEKDRHKETEIKSEGNKRERIRNEGRRISEQGFTANACSQGLQVASCRKQREISGQTESFQGGEPGGTFTAPAGWESFPTQSPVRSRNDGLSAGLVGITVPRHRNESIKAYGNAIVPEVVYEIFKAIEQYEKL